ncbi:phage tail protein [Frankia sp. AgKG'84/4]|uniref:phage tail protein n=1 Tax=Frankia sp. AgKG'84/4 TaxID=573490 RepID=UPI00200C9BDD|nr:phage tail protein [Frankia sp. AgKG'84/4]MCL9796094.1 phage tail protein [Frankia sp. AgKG'84/4]
MSLSSGDSIAAHNFALQIDGVQVEYLSEVSALSLEQDVIKYVQNSPKGVPSVKMMPGISQGGTVTVTRGQTHSTSFSSWINDSMRGDMSSARKNASIVFMDYENKPLKRYDLRNAWCCKIESGAPKAGEASVLTEQVTITFEELVIG